MSVTLVSPPLPPTPAKVTLTPPTSSSSPSKSETVTFVPVGVVADPDVPSAA